ncbi:hypothetical protein VTO42DRAFT_5118 [Malbranchea cinnamomea]
MCAAEMGSVEGLPILQTLTSSPEHFLQPSARLHGDALASVKQFLDPLAFGITQEQQAQKKRKRSDSSDPLRLREVHVDGFTSQQVWEQAQRVLKSCNYVIGRDLPTIAAIAVAKPQSAEDSSETPSDENDVEQLSSDGRNAEASQDEVEGMELDEDDDTGHDNLSDEEKSDAISDVDASDDEGAAERPQGIFQPDRFGLNDGFFSIDDFNRQTAFFEQQDSKTVVEEDEDDEAVDWDADPFAGEMDDDDDDVPEEIEEDLGDEAEEEDEDIDMDAEVTLDDQDEKEKKDPRNMRYEDFFDPPPLNVQQKHKSSPKQTKEKSLRQTDEELEDEVKRAISDVRRDLFEDESEEEYSGSDMDSDRGAVDLKGLSTHEQRRAKLADEIRKLEAANVAKKDWTLSGEAVAADRPQNALLEENLEFEHVGKPVPVITAEITDEIETLIKRRIIAKEFDDIIRRYPLALGEQGVTKKGKFELDDSKPQQSLAELYEIDHLRATDPAYVDVKDAKLKKEHDEIRQLWAKICSQLDTLSNWHYRPKRPAASINVVQDVATITMEDVRPSGAGGVEPAAMLAPQEVYAPGDDGKNPGEVILKSGAAISKDEMSREAKARRRRREKQKLKKAGLSGPKAEGAVAEKQQVISELKKGGVKVIGKEGRLEDVHGNEVKTSAGLGKREVFKL